MASSSSHSFRRPPAAVQRWRPARESLRATRPRHLPAPRLGAGANPLVGKNGSLGVASGLCQRRKRGERRDDETAERREGLGCGTERRNPAASSATSRRRCESL